MEKYPHLNLPEERIDLERQRRRGGGGFKSMHPDKGEFYNQISQNTNKLATSFSNLKRKYHSIIDPNLIYRISTNQKVDAKIFENVLLSSGIHLVSIAPDKKGYWVVFSDENALTTFKNKLAQYTGVQQGNRYDYFNAIDTLEDIPVNEKIGDLLSKQPILENEQAFLDLELWRIEDDRKLNLFINSLKNRQLFPSNFRVCDQLITNSFAKLRILTNKENLDKLLEFKEIAFVDRPFSISRKNFEYNQIDISEFAITAPQINATGILIIDSGIISNNPFLADSIGDAQNFQDVDRNENDTVGHGTAVAGCALFGDIDYCIKEKQFDASNFIFSAKVMYGEEDINGNFQARYDPEKLIEHQFDNAIRYFLDNDENKIKVVNISLGNLDEMFGQKHLRQFPLASLIDDLAYNYSNVVFIVATGNQNPINVFDSIDEITSNFPNYLLNNDNFKLINPATSALALTIGSIAAEVEISQRVTYTTEEINLPIAKKFEPSPFTRTGFGLNNMIKPELVEIGGNLILREVYGRILDNTGGHIAVISNKVDRNFEFNFGTSFSAPKVAHILGQLANIYPDASANFLKNLLLQSANYGVYLKNSSWSDTEEVKNNLRLQGYGKPDFERAINSFTNRVVLLNEGTIGLNKLKLFSFPIPSDYFSQRGLRSISIVLTYNPITRATRGDSYIGNSLDFKLFHTVSSDDLKTKFANFAEETDGEVEIPEEIKKYEIKLIPSTNIRKVGCHQKGIKEYKRNPTNEINAPFTIVVFNFNKWISDTEYQQSFCISVEIKHTEEIELYETIRTELQLRDRLTIR